MPSHHDLSHTHYRTVSLSREMCLNCQTPQNTYTHILTCTTVRFDVRPRGLVLCRVLHRLWQGTVRVKEEHIEGDVEAVARVVAAEQAGLPSHTLQL